jgi:hypothetical protein
MLAETVKLLFRLLAGVKKKVQTNREMVSVADFFKETPQKNKKIVSLKKQQRKRHQ